MAGRGGHRSGHAHAGCPGGIAGGCVAKDWRCPAMMEHALSSLHIAHCVVLAICPAQGDCIKRLFSFTHMHALVGSPIKLIRPSMKHHGGTHHGWAACLLLHAALRALAQRCALHELKASVVAMPPVWQGHHESHLESVHCASAQGRYASDELKGHCYAHLCP